MRLLFKLFVLMQCVCTLQASDTNKMVAEEQTILHRDLQYPLIEQRVSCKRCELDPIATYESDFPIISIINSSYDTVDLLDWNIELKKGETFLVPQEVYSFTFTSKRLDGELAVFCYHPRYQDASAKAVKKQINTDEIGYEANGAKDFDLGFHLGTVNTSTTETYPINPKIDISTWAHVSNYFLPFDHPIRSKLDALLSKLKVINRTTLEKAGFTFYKSGKSNAIVAKHSSLKGYLLKIYPDDLVLSHHDWTYWIKRITGANAIRKAIKNHNAQKEFKVPHKWLFPVPLPSSCQYQRKNFILVVEDMQIVPRKKNESMWQSIAVTKKILDTLFAIAQEEGLMDSMLAFNIPFSKDGRISFVDTEQHHKWPVPFWKMKSYLCPYMARYWDKLIKEKLE